MYLYLLNWISLTVQALALTFAIGAGLFYLAEIIEEYAHTAKRIIIYLLLTLSCMCFGLAIFEDLPLTLTLIPLISNGLYYLTMRTFPVVEMTSPAFISSIVLFAIHHYIAFKYFLGNYHFEFYEMITYLTLFCWLIPVILLASLSANDNVLPVHFDNFSNDKRNGSDNSDLVTNYFKRKGRKIGLLSGFRYFQESYLPRTQSRKSY